MSLNCKDSLNLTLPWAPSVNHYKTIGALTRTKSGKIYQQRRNSNETKMYYWEVYKRFKEEMLFKPLWRGQDSTISFELRVNLHPPHDRRYDIDNRLKVLLDSLVRAKVIYDDSQIIRLIVEKREFFPNGKIDVEIHILNSPNFSQKI